MKQTVKKRTWLFPCLLLLLLLLQLAVNGWFGFLKQGFHYDEYYSYYSSNVTYRLLPTDREWKDVDELRSEFAVLPGGQFQYPMVVLMQTFDVHPPVYYLLLHTVCSFFPGVFSKWTGIGLNLFFFALCFLLLAWLAYRLTGGRKDLTLLTCMLFGLNPGVISGVTFIRMYLLLTVLLFLLTCIHAAAVRRGRLTFLRFYLPLMGTVYLGFLTHYYFFVYLAMLAFAFACWIFFRGGCVPAGPKEGCRSSLGRRFGHVCRYGLFIAAALALAVCSYPACLSHIFRGYRGTGAASAFFDLSNTGERLSFFLDLLNSFVFGGCLPALLLLLVTAGYLHSRRAGAGKTGSAENADRSGSSEGAGWPGSAENADRPGSSEGAGWPGSVENADRSGSSEGAGWPGSAENADRSGSSEGAGWPGPAAGADAAGTAAGADAAGTAAGSGTSDSETGRSGFLSPAIGILAFAAAGYFLVVAKTALMTAEEANRYEQPVYGLILLLALLLTDRAAAFCLSGRPLRLRKPTAASRFPAALTAVTAAVLLAAQIAGLASGKVLFLYQDDTQDYAFAREHRDDTILYFYNNDLQWMIWDDSLELMQYDDIYFVNLADPSPVTDPEVTASDRLIVYAMRSENTRTALANLPAGNPFWNDCRKIGERLYCDIYEID